MTLHHLSLDYGLGFTAWLIAGGIAFVVLLKLRRRWKEQRKRLLAVNLGLSLWMLLFLLTLVEVYFATVYDQSDSFNTTLVSQKWFKLHVEPQQKTLKFKDGKVLIYRDDREFPQSIPDDKHHICFIGDSFTFGHGVPDVADRFSNRVRASLDDEHPGEFVVTNLADSGTSLDWVEEVLKRLFADDRRIDTVVYVMCLNDVEVYHPDHNKLYAEELPKLAPKWAPFRHSYFLNFLTFRYRQYSHPRVRGYYSFVRDYYDGAPWDRMKQDLSGVRDLCRRNNSELRVVVFPFLHNLGPDYPFRDAHRMVVRYCRSIDVPALDLDPVLAPHVEEGLTVNRFDAHPNERAHELAAEAIRTQLLDDVVTSRDD